MTATSAFRVNSYIVIPRQELRFTFVRSSGPGGQNVNKVASKAVLRFNAANSPSLSEEVRGRLLAQMSRRLTERGELVLTSQRYRDQAKNIDDCLEKLRSILLAAAKRPKARKKTRPSKGAKESRLREKRVTSEKKRRRSRTNFDD